MTRELEVVIAPRTRLAAALLARPVRDGVRRVLLVRHDADAAWAASEHPDLETVRPGELPDGFPFERVTIYATALGAMTPEPLTDTLARDSEALQRDLGVVGAVIEAQQGAPVHVAFVSTVLALSPRRERQYYAGWKCIAEHEVARVCSERATLSVVYPGRLVQRRSAGPGLLYTPYTSVAQKLERGAAKSADARRVVGVDARLWLAVRGLKTGAMSVT